MTPEDIKIDITITMGDTCSNTMSIDDAKLLYNSLSNLFANNQLRTIQPTTSPNTMPAPIRNYPQPVVTSSTESTIVEKEESLKDKYKTLLDSKQKELDALIASMPTYNSKVEAARERAAQRTSGCGSKR